MTVSEEFRNNSSQATRVLIYVDDEIYDDTYYGGDRLMLDAGGSSLEFNRQAEARTSGSLKFLARTAESAEALDPLAGAIIAPMSGVLTDGVMHWEPLGQLRVETSSSVQLSSRGNTGVSVSAVDKSEIIRDNRWGAPFSTGGGTYRQAIEAIVTNRYPDVGPILFLYEHAGTVPAITYTEDEDPWAAAFGLARDSLSELYFNKRGMLVVSKVPDPDTMEATYVLGGSDFRFEVGQRTKALSRREVFNGVICRGEAPWLLFPIGGEYWDENPASPTYRYGSFGEKPKKIGSTVATTDAQCAAIAKAEYDKIAGASEEIQFSFLKDPTLDVGTMIEVRHADSHSYYMLESVGYPLGASPMTATIRRRRI